MISAKEANQMVDKLKEDIVESYEIEKTENLKIVEQMINEEIQNLGEGVWLPVGMKLSNEEYTYLVRKGYRIRLCTNTAYNINGGIDIECQYFISWGGNQL